MKVRSETAGALEFGCEAPCIVKEPTSTQVLDRSEHGAKGFVGSVGGCKEGTKTRVRIDRS